MIYGDLTGMIDEDGGRLPLFGKERCLVFPGDKQCFGEHIGCGRIWGDDGD